MIRAFKLQDVEPAKKIFEKFYSQDSNGRLSFPDFSKDYICAFTVEDDDGIITTGGVRVIAEACLITDKDKSIRSRVEALKEVLLAIKFIVREFNFDRIHAVTDDPTWANQMKEHGFVSRGEDLEIHVGDIK